MNSQQEYEMFMAKVAKALDDIRDALDELSPMNKARVMQEANARIRALGYTITIEDLMRNYLW